MYFGEDAFQATYDVSRETLDRLQAYENLIRKWNPAINLIAASTLEDIWGRHFSESAQLFDFSDATAGRWLDMGSGGGFPGAVAAILALERAPDLAITCIESDTRKCEFLRAVARTTGARIVVMSSRIEETPPQSADYVSARALCPLPKLLSYAQRHLKPDGEALFLKGESWTVEVAKATKEWKFEIETCASATNPGSALLKIRNIARA